MTSSNPLIDPSHWPDEATSAAYIEGLRIARTLQDAGHVAYFAGGCVRDALLGRVPKDFDVATDATPNRVRKVFGRNRTLAFGASFGVIAVLPPRSDETNGLSEPTEVATFRSDGTYSDGRRPDAVVYGDAKNDALRRDFTINGIFYDPVSQEVIDHVDGRSDLDRSLIRTIGDPELRFGEDKLRMLRAIRFATTLGFRIDEPTKNAIILHAEDIDRVSAERIGAEIRRIVTARDAVVGLKLLVATELHRTVFPESAFADTVYLEKLLNQRQTRPVSVSIALILRAIARSVSDTSEDQILEKLVQRWRLSNDERRACQVALKHWETIANAHQLPWSQVQPILIDRDIDSIVAFAECVVAAESRDPDGVALVRDALTWPAERLAPQPLISGDRLRQAGYAPGPHFKYWLQEIRDQQLDGRIDTEEQALQVVRSLAEKSADRDR